MKILKTNKVKYFLLIVMSFCLLFALCACNDNKDNTSDNTHNPESSVPEQIVMVDEGTCGDSITWKLMSDGEFTLSGTGTMENYNMDILATVQKKSPWYDYSNDIKKVVVQEGILSIGDYAFWFCQNLTELSLPNGLNTVGKSAFSFCKISNLKIPYTVTTIKDSAFRMNSLTSVEIPYKVSVLEKNAIKSDNMVEYKVASGSNYFSAKDGVLYDYLGKKLIAYPAAKSDTVFVMPEVVTSVNEQAFYECNNLESIIVSPNLTTIGTQGFMYCSNITAFSIPDSVEYIGSGAFDGCLKLSSIHIGAGVRYLTGHYFGSCNLSNITISANNQFYTVSGGKVYSKDMMTLVYYPCNLPGETYNIPFGVKEIGPGCFYSANYLKNINIPETVEKIGYGAFEYVDITSIYIPKSVTEIGFSAFSGCNNLATINYGGSSSDWINITIGEWNSILLQAERNYNYIN